MNKKRKEKLKHDLFDARSNVLEAESKHRKLEMILIKECSPISSGDKVFIIKPNGTKIKARCSSVHYMEIDKFKFRFSAVKENWERCSVHKVVNYFPDEDEIEKIKENQNEN